MSMSLMLTSGMWLPLRRRAQDGKDRLVVFETYDQLMAYDVSFAEFADTTQQMFTQMAVLRDTALHPPVQRRLVTSGYLQGFSIHSSGLAVRPALPRQDILLPLLRTHLQQFPGPGWGPPPDLMLPQGDDRTHQIRLETAAPWCDLCRKAQQSSSHLKDFRRLSLRKLQFH
eukprot:Skav201810  [mRNA]  locus=scaffold1071:210770:211282:- [translate_table: standard]